MYIIMYDAVLCEMCSGMALANPEGFNINVYVYIHYCMYTVKG